MKTNAAFRLLLKGLACFALMACGSAQAFNCSVMSNGFSSFYDPASPTQNVTAASFTMTCTRDPGDGTSLTYTVQANSGLHSRNGFNRAQFRFGNRNYRINYNVYTNSSCSSLWQGNTTLGGTITFANDFAPRSQTVNYWACIPPGQNVPAGTYTDTVTMNPSRGNNATFPVSIVTPSSCSISTPPGNVTFNYSSFQAAAASASTAFAVTCTASMPYTMALDATSGTLLGLNYTLSLSASSASGNGVAQSYTINGSIAAGQAGTCSGATCSANATRTLTLTY